MKKNLKYFVIIVSLIVLALFIGYNYVIHGGQRNLEQEQVSFSTKSKTIIAEFTSNIDAANKKYLEKAIEISGIVTSVKNHEVIIDNVIICSFKNINESLKVDQNVTVKGRVVGYDDLMSELRLDQCCINK